MQVHVPVPVGIEAAVEGSTVHLSWNTTASRDGSILGYRVYRKNSRAKFLTPVADTLQESWQNYFTDTGLAPGSTTSYAVRAVSITADTSDMSMTVVASISSPEYYPPGNVRAWKEKKSVQITWDDIVQPGAKELRIYRYTRGSTPKIIKKLKVNIHEYVDTKPGRGKLVSYYLTTVGEGGEESVRSSVVSVPLK
jgi:fibronectin type 3 domain-containing protein